MINLELVTPIKPVLACDKLPSSLVSYIMEWNSLLSVTSTNTCSMQFVGLNILDIVFFLHFRLVDIGFIGQKVFTLCSWLLSEGSPRYLAGYTFSHNGEYLIALCFALQWISTCSRKNISPMSLCYLEPDKYWVILGFPFKSCKHYWTCTSGTMLGYKIWIQYDINQHGIPQRAKNSGGKGSL